MPGIWQNLCSILFGDDAKMVFMRRRATPLILASLGIALGLSACSTDRPVGTNPDVVATYSIVARDPATGELGVAVQSKFFSVGSVVPWAEAGVGAVATQALANIAFGPEGLDRMRAGESAETALTLMLAKDPGAENRQVGLIDAAGNVAAHTGSECLDYAGHRVGIDYSVQGNILAGPEVLDAMARAFEAARGAAMPLADALTKALQASEDAGGDRRGRQSAALLVVRKKGGYQGQNDRFIDLRVEDHPDPTQELTRLLSLHRDFFANRHRGQ